MADENHRKQTLLRRFFIGLFRVKSILFWELVDLLSGKNQKIAAIYKNAIVNEYNKEYNFLQIQPTDTILHIGCGAYPLTEMTLVEHSNIKVVGIDNKPKAISHARQIVKTKKLEHHIAIKRGDGINYPVDKFSVIILSSCAYPKLPILKHLVQKAHPDTTIVIRELDIAIDPILEFINNQKKISIRKQIEHTPFPYSITSAWTTLIFKKKG